MAEEKLKPTWTVRQYRPEDKAGALALMKDVAGHEPDTAMWEWYIEHNPYGANLGWVADDHGRIAGKYGMIPMELQIKGKRMPVAQAVEIMTHPDYRRQGMFTVMGETVFAELPATGFQLAIGFPNDAARPGHQKIGWKEVGWISAAMRPIRSGVMTGRLIKNPVLARLAGVAGDVWMKLAYDWRKPAGLDKVQTKQIGSFEQRFDDLWQRVSSRYTVSLVRDARYLNWRYVAGPYHYIKRSFEMDGRLVGASVVRVLPRGGATEGHICDLILEDDPPWLFDVAAWYAIQDCKRAGADLVGFRMKSVDDYPQRFRKLGALTYQGKMILIVYDKLLPPGTVDVDLADANNWCVSFGDSDAI